MPLSFTVKNDYICTMARENSPVIAQKKGSGILKERVSTYVKEGLPVRTDTVMRLAALDPDSEMSSEDLASIILADIGLTAKVIQSVNSFYYRRVGHEVTSVTQAVVLLGFNTIREIALGMALIDLAEHKGGSTLVSLIFSSYFAAHLAQELLHHSTPTHEGDAILVAGLFHSIARVILSLDSEEAYQELEQLEHSNEAEAHRLLKELGELISIQWKLPPFIAQNLEGLASDQMKVSAIIKGAHCLGRGLALKESDPHKIEEAIKCLSTRAGLKEAVLREKIGISLKNAVGLSPRFKRLVVDHSRIRLLMEETKAEGPPAARGTKEPAKGREQQFLELFTQLSSAIATRRITLDQAFLLATETIYRGIGADWAILMLLTKDRHAMSPRYGLGPEVKLYKNRIDIPFPPKDRVLKAAFEQNKEVLAAISSLFKKGTTGCHPSGDRALVCAISPIVVEYKPIGCFVIGRDKGTFDERDLLRLKAVKDLIVMATTRR